MIIDNRIFFGHGTILVGSHTIPAGITFTATSIPHPVGKLIESNDNQRGETISFELDHTRNAELTQKLQQVENREIDSFFFCGYTFDFTCYNSESIRVIHKHRRTAMSRYIQAMAC